jgi:anti-sigma B factor antagonist
MTIFESAPRDPRPASPADDPTDAPEPFDIDIEPDRERIVLVPRGELDLATVDRLGACIDGIVDAGFEAIVLDLRRLTFLDSTGLRLVANECRRDDVTVRLIDGPECVSRLFDLTGMRAMLPFVQPTELRFRR